MEDLFNTDEYTEFDLLAELSEELLVAENGASEDPSQDGFHITEERHVIWFNERMEQKARAINFYSGIRARKLAKMESIFKREVERIEEEHAKQVEPFKRDIVWLLNRFGQEVKNLLPSLLKKGTKSKKWGNIQVGHRTSSEKLQVVDDEALKEWALEQEDEEGKLVKIEPKVNLNEMAKRYKETGEIPPGTRKVPAEEKFFYNVHGMNMVDILGHEWLAAAGVQNPLEDPATMVITEEEPDMATQEALEAVAEAVALGEPAHTVSEDGSPTDPEPTPSPSPAPGPALEAPPL